MSTSDQHSKQKPFLTPTRMVVTLLVVFTVGYFLGGSGGDETEPEVSMAEDGSPAMFTCAMHPQIRQSEPGLCPICNMELTAVSETTSIATGAAVFTTTKNAAALMGLETAPVERKFVGATVRMVGKVTFDETTVGMITSWVPGRLERLFVDYTGVEVNEGDHLVRLYSPELITAQEELRRAAQAAASMRENSPEALRRTTQATLKAARETLRRWGLTEEQIKQAESTGEMSDYITIYAPQGGIVIEKQGKEGMYVDTGTPIYTIADLSTVWVEVEAYETDLVWLHYGQMVQFATEAYPGEVFEGRIAFIGHQVDPETRTVGLRVNVPNEERKLKPGMFVRGKVEAQLATDGRVMDPGLAGKWISPMHPEIVKDEPGACDVCGMPLVPASELGYVPQSPDDSMQPLVIPATAPLITGRRAVVYVAHQDANRPTYEGREVVLGPRAGDYYIVESGLREGDVVVAHGAFKIDSALEIQARPSMMSIEGEMEKPAPGKFANVPRGFREALRDLFEDYGYIHEALAGDNAEGAKVHADEAREFLGEMDVDLLPEDAQTSWNDEISEPLSEALDVIAGTEEIADQRAAFKILSDALTEAIRSFGLSEDGAVYIAHCPMAFDFTGADWLQTDDTIRNPYFGAEMFTCGTIQEQIVEAGSGAAGGGGAHAGHSHAEGS